MTTTNKQQEAEVLEVYETWLNSYLNGDVKTYDSYLADDYRFIGSTDNEDFLSKTDTTNFFEATAEQLAGKVEIRNNRRTIEKFNELFFITDLFDAYFLNDKDWAFYGKFRFTSALKKNIEGWRFIYQHFSTPDIKAQEGETIGLEKISQENLELREAVRRRTIELEHKTRELEIEATLEKVRSRSLAMQHSNEIQEVVTVVAEKLIELGVILDAGGVIICTYFNDSKDVVQWIAAPDLSYSGSYYVPYFDHPVFNECWDLKNSGIDYSSRAYSYEVKKSFFEYAFEHSDFKKFPKEVKNWFFEQKFYSLSFAWAKNSAILIPSHTGVVPSKSDKEILIRFAKVFEQAYIRFLDLQKAEAQARGAQIEAALEKVRSRSLAMHKSDELKDMVAVVFEKLMDLGFELEKGAAIILIFQKDSKDHFEWIADPTQSYVQCIRMPYFENPLLSDITNGWENGTGYYSREYSFEVKNDFFIYAFKNTDYKHIPDAIKETLLKAEKYSYSIAFEKNSAIGVPDATGKIFSEEKAEILKRFVRVFEQAYIRFLDLQKAEAQAREAEIELALERVRARTMAMQKSDELLDAAILLFHQLKQLQINAFATGFVLLDTLETEAEFWMSAEGEFQPVIYIPKTDEPILQNLYNNWENGAVFHIEEAGGERLKSHAEYLRSLTKSGHIFRKMQSAGIEFPECQQWNAAYFTHGYLLAITKEPFAEANILKRFAKVFEQTYTRFLDLQKAEAQAREAKIEVSLERVRARAMAMHHSNELLEASKVLFEQLNNIGFEAESSWITLVNPKENSEEIWATHGAQFSVKRVKASDHPNFKAEIDAWKSGVEFLKLSNTKENFIEAAKEIFDFDVKDIKDKSEFYLLQIRHRFGFLGLGTWEETNQEEYQIYKRFAKVFEQTYTRFLDLQKAEAQAREAQIEVALERVRARMMAMHKSEELREVVDTVFKQLQSLGFDATGSALIIYNKDLAAEHWMTGFSNSEFPESYKIPYNDHPYFIELLVAWQNGVHFQEFYFEGELKQEYTEWLLEYSDFKQMPPELKKEMKSPIRLVISDAFNKYGMLEIMSPESLSEEKISVLKRFSKVFEQTYTRFLDLQKAEAQAREAQIEAALEKVRSRSLAMHKTDELQEVVTVLVEKLQELGVIVDAGGVIICTYFKDSKDVMHWIASPDFSYSGSYLLPWFDHVIFNEAWESRLSGAEYFSKSFSVEEKNSFFEYAFEHSDYKNFPDEFKNWVFESKKHSLSFAWAKNSAILIPSFSEIEPSESAKQILIRFAKVFEQAYVRFMDMQKAETQARESEIQLALERVRARTMAMQHSDELAETGSVLFEQLEAIGIIVESSWITLVDPEEDSMTIWVTHGTQMVSPRKVFASDHYNFRTEIDAWKRNQEFIQISMPVEAFIPLVKEMFDIEFKNRPGETLIHVQNLRHRFGFLGLTSYEPINEKEIAIYKRFTRVFEQTYTRFLDLQKAEAQAHEAEIQLALERVRARTMAMHKSEELGDVSRTLYAELQSLGFADFVNCGFINIDEAKNIQHGWGTLPGSEPQEFFLPLGEEPVTLERYQAWKRGDPVLYQEVGGAKLKRHIEYVMPHLGSAEVEDMVKTQFSDPTYFYSGNFKHGYLFVVSILPYDNEQLTLIQKFTSAFELAYRRFLDLQKAEAQAREAQIETALERVRSRTMGMQKSDELAELNAIILQQVKILNVPLFAAGIHICNPEKPLTETWIGDPVEGQMPKTIIDHSQDPLCIRMYQGWKEKNDFIIDVMEGDALKEHFRNMAKYIPEQKMFEVPVLPDRLFYHLTYFSYGFFVFTTVKSCPENHDIFKRFAKVFEQTYTRFLDLQKAEAQAREAVKQASLDRVRGEIASMRTKNDLNRITPLIWKELNTLGVPFIRCGVFIMNEEKRMIQTYLSTPDGKSLTAFEMDYNSKEVAAGAVFHWNKKEIYQDHWDKKQFVRFMQNLIKTGQIKNTESFQGSAAPPESLDLHFLPFKQGMLYVGNTSPLAHEELQLVQSLADSFSIAYARYEDFNQLEEAKNQIENTLTELKSTQSQLIQAEKMASLGQLTAGIAHEIQNPLNFVNNFSELSIDLIDEMDEELANGNDEEVKAIKEDLKQNLEKINHHGNRASSIVKGMLQHSRTSKGQKELTDINALADEYLRLAYHGLRAKDKSFNASFKTDFDPTLPKINVIPQDIGRVLLNLINNAFYAVQAPPPPEGGIKNSQTDYKPTVIVRTASWNPPSGGMGASISVIDNGPGIPAQIVDKIFQPFFTTKPTGQGTGLGLSLSYDIVKAHGGELKVETKEGEGTEFIIQLPII